jgi:outer membrane protein OmpA-like peptidoglycan-associated protein
MRLRGFLRVGLLVAAATCWACATQAQVTVDLHALDQVQGGTGGAPAAPSTRHAPPRHRAKPKPAPVARAEPKPATPATAAPATAATAQPAPATSPPASPAAPATAAAVATPPQATLPTAAPPLVSLAPGGAAVPAPATPPPAPPVVADAGGGATPTPDGLRVLFAPDRADLSPETEFAIKGLATTKGRNQSATFNVLAYAAGTKDDPSAARRLSLSRALAVREALMADGVESTRIYVRALGASVPDGPADRADIGVLGANAPPPPPPAAPASASGGAGPAK